MKMLTIAEAAKITPNTDAFEDAVEAAAAACEANPKDKDAAALLTFLLMKNSDFVIGAIYG